MAIAVDPAQDEIERTAKKYNVLDAGRRFGKNEFLVSRAVGAPKLVPPSAARHTAATTSGCACPRMSGPHEQT